MSSLSLRLSLNAVSVAAVLSFLGTEAGVDAFAVYSNHAPQTTIALHFINTTVSPHVSHGGWESPSDRRALSPADPHNLHNGTINDGTVLPCAIANQCH